jgi:hypothetical protein
MTSDKGRRGEAHDTTQRQPANTNEKRLDESVTCLLAFLPVFAHNIGGVFFFLVVFFLLVVDRFLFLHSTSSSSSSSSSSGHNSD